MKKLIALLLAMVMVIGLFAACEAKVDVNTKDDKDEEETASTAESTNESTDGEEADNTEEFIEDTEEFIEDTIPAAELNASAQVLQNIWEKFPEAEAFPVAGGDFESSVMGGAGNLNLASSDYLIYNLLIPEDQIAVIVEGGSLSHMMNANTFTSGVVTLAEGTDVAAFAAACKDAIQGNQWICGFPETLLIANIEGRVLVAYGINDAMTPFITHMNEAYSSVEVLYNEAIAA